MGMLMHRTWVAQQEAKKQPLKTAEATVVTKEPEPDKKAKEQIVRKPGRRKATK